MSNPLPRTCLRRVGGTTLAASRAVFMRYLPLLGRLLREILFQHHVDRGNARGARERICRQTWNCGENGLSSSTFQNLRRTHERTERHHAPAERFAEAKDYRARHSSAGMRTPCRCGPCPSVPHPGSATRRIRHRVGAPAAVIIRWHHSARLALHRFQNDRRNVLAEIHELLEFALEILDVAVSPRNRRPTARVGTVCGTRRGPSRRVSPSTCHGTRPWWR